MTLNEFILSQKWRGDVDPDYIVATWNAAVQACLDEISQYVDAPPVIESYLQNLKVEE